MTSCVQLALRVPDLAESVAVSAHGPLGVEVDSSSVDDTTNARSVAGENLPYLAERVVDEHVPSGWIGPPPAECGVEEQAEQDRYGQ